MSGPRYVGRRPLRTRDSQQRMGDSSSSAETSVLEVTRDFALGTQMG